MATHHLDDTQPHAFGTILTLHVCVSSLVIPLVFETLEASAGQVEPDSRIRGGRELKLRPHSPAYRPCICGGCGAR